MATNLKIPFEGLTHLLDILRTNLDGGGAGGVVELYQNDRTPAADDELADYDIADFTGYTGVGIDAAGDGVIDPAPDGGNRCVCNWPAQTWTHPGGGTGNTIYGYFVRDVANTKLLWAQRAPDGPVSMSVSGDSITITPQLTLKSEF